MSSIHGPQQYGSQKRADPDTLPRVRSIMLEADHHQLRRHLELCEQTRHPAWNFIAFILRDKILSSEPVRNLHDRNIVTGSSCVTYSVNCEPGLTGLLLHRARSGASSGIIPVCSLLGATLIGMRIGQRAPLLCEDGTIMSLFVLDVTPPD